MNLPISFTDAPVFKHHLMTMGEDGAHYRKDLPPGTARWSDFDSGTQLAFVCPCGCGVANQLPVHTGESGYGWKWDGNREKPTLMPSIAMTTKCKWHGFLTAGEFRS